MPVDDPVPEPVVVAVVLAVEPEYYYVSVFVVPVVDDIGVDPDELVGVVVSVTVTGGVPEVEYYYVSVFDATVVGVFVPLDEPDEDDTEPDELVAVPVEVEDTLGFDTVDVA